MDLPEEEFQERIVADGVLSPSAQLRITPLRDVQLLSTQDQLLGGPPA